MAFLHLIGMPLFLVLGIWLHVFRISGPKINPPRTLMAGTLLAMLVLSLVYPAYSQGPAELARVPETLGLDWYYLLVYPLVQEFSPTWVWGLLSGITVLLFAAPWLPPARRARPAVVDLDNCNGCERCVNDCPFDAVSMAPRSDGKAYESEAVVDPDLCISCGICVGACPTATPFRTRSALVPGIDLPDLPALSLRNTLHEASQAQIAIPRVIAVACQGSSAAARLKRSGASLLEVKCLAQLPPSFLDYALSRNLAEGLLMSGCGGDDCRFRLGSEWTMQRIQRTRDPQLRERVDRARIALAWEHPWTDFSDPVAMLDALRQRLSAPIPDKLPEHQGKSRPALRFAALILGYGVLALVTGWLSNSPAYRQLEPGQAVVSLSFSHAGQRLQACRTLDQNELNKLPPNMRAASDCPRGRHPVHVELRLDKEIIYTASLEPSGLWSDGESTIYRRLAVDAGQHSLFIGMRDSDREQGFDYQMSSLIELSQNQNLLVEFDQERQEFFLR
jgi:ferredoxin/coenzyme F420-reducing hydrogenase delta subunit